METLTIDEATEILTGMRLVLRTVGITEIGSKEVWTPSLDDVEGSIASLGDAVENTRIMCGVSKYTTSEFAVSKEVALELREIILPPTADSTLPIAQRRCNAPLFYLLLMPIVSSLDKFSHREALAYIPSINDWVLREIAEFDNYGTREDAIVALHTARKAVAVCERRYKRRYFSGK